MICFTVVKTITNIIHDLFHSSKDDNESNNLLDDKSNNKQEDVSNNKFVPPQTEKKVSFDEPESDANKATPDKRGGFKPSDEPEAPAPSPQVRPKPSETDRLRWYDIIGYL